MAEWFHKETLTPVQFIGKGFAAVAIKAAVGPAFDIAGTELHSDYQRNEPVTVDLLGRLGWGCGPTSKGCYCDWQVGDRLFTAWWRADEHDEPDDFTVSHDGCEPQSLPFPATLRDLLNVLRVFGVQSQPRNEGSGE